MRLSDRGVGSVMRGTFAGSRSLGEIGIIIIIVAILILGGRGTAGELGAFGSLQESRG